ncbi:MAG: hypothetical protein ABIG64_06120 [Candidatus Omnitrophota bacterium]
MFFNAGMTIYHGVMGFIFIRSSAFLTPFIFHIITICLGIVQFFVIINFKKQEIWTKKAIFGVIGIKLILNYFQNMGALNIFWLIFTICLCFLLKYTKIGWLFQIRGSRKA